MESLKMRILTEGRAIGTDRINVDGFINHQVDVKLMMEMGEEFSKRFRDDKIDKILTIEASGIAIAMATSISLGGIPMVFAKKAKPNTMVSDSYEQEAMSFTKGIKNNITVSKKYLNKGERILIIDDFLAHGEASNALVKIVEKAEAIPVGVGIAVCKLKQGGMDILKNQKIKVEALVMVEDVIDGNIIFK